MFIKADYLIIIVLLFVALELLKLAIGKAGYSDKVVIGMDIAASEFFRDGKYDLDFKSPPNPNRYVTHDKLIELYMSFIKNYPVMWSKEKNIIRMEALILFPSIAASVVYLMYPSPVFNLKFAVYRGLLCMFVMVTDEDGVKVLISKVGN
eukprot:g42484.t1